MEQANKQPNPATASVAPSTAKLLSDLSQLIDSTRQRVARTVNAELVLMCWKMGARIHQDILGQERAAYGEQIVSTLSRQLSASHGSGFSRPNLFHMIRFVEAWPVEKEAAELAQHMGWSHFKEILYVSGGGGRGHFGGVVRARPLMASGGKWPDCHPNSLQPAEAFVMSFLRHEQIYQSDLVLD